MKQVIYTEKATAPTACYSQAVKVGNIVFLAGVCGDDPKTGEIQGDGNVKIETRYAMENLKNTIEAADGKMDDIVKVDVFVKDIAMMEDFNEVYHTYFPVQPPARIAMAISDLTGGANLELDAYAVLKGEM